jgi:hypothetical protein
MPRGYSNTLYYQKGLDEKFNNNQKFSIGDRRGLVVVCGIFASSFS